MTAGSRRSPWNPAPAPMRSVLLSGMERRSGELAGRPLAGASIAAPRAAGKRPPSPPTPPPPPAGGEGGAPRAPGGAPAVRNKNIETLEQLPAARAEAELHHRANRTRLPAARRPARPPPPDPAPGAE